MQTINRLIRSALVCIGTSLIVSPITLCATPGRATAAKDSASFDFRPTDVNSSEAEGTVKYQWNIREKDAPLLGLDRERLRAGFDQALTYPSAEFDFPIFHPLVFDESEGKYLLPAISRTDKNLAFIELVRTTTPNTYRSAEGIELIDRDTLKTVRIADGTRYLFVQYPDGEFRCAAIKEAGGTNLNLLYNANGLALHGVSDSSGRSLTFNYGKEGIQSLTQTWMANSEGFTRTWTIGDQNFDDGSFKYAHAVGLKSAKFLPSNAVVREYTAEMAACDKLLARMFGGPNAVAGANGFEPPGLAAAYPLYRGDIIGDDGKVRRGHLSYAIHLYGSADGRGDSPLYIPAGFTSHSSEPSPTDAAVLFYYPRLGNLTDVTLAVFHVADFQMNAEGDRVRIGNIGGLGGSSPLYKHSHIEFYKGDTGLPPAAARAALRIDPATVFGK